MGTTRQSHGRSRSGLPLHGGRSAEPPIRRPTTSTAPAPSGIPMYCKPSALRCWGPPLQRIPRSGHFTAISACCSATGIIRWRPNQRQSPDTTSSGICSGYQSVEPSPATTPAVRASAPARSLIRQMTIGNRRFRDQAPQAGARLRLPFPLRGLPDHGRIGESYRHSPFGLRGGWNVRRRSARRLYGMPVKFGRATVSGMLQRVVQWWPS